MNRVLKRDGNKSDSVMLRDSLGFHKCDGEPLEGFKLRSGRPDLGVEETTVGAL